MINRWILVPLVCLVGCAGEIARTPEPTEMSDQFSWPEPPDRARISYLHSFKDYKDLGLKLPISRRVGDALGGKKNRSMVRPYAIAVDDDLLAVADPGAGAVHLFYQRRDRYLNITQVDGTYLNSPVGVSLANNRIFISDSSLNQVFVFDRNSKVISTISDLARPTGLAWDGTSRQLFVSETLSHKLQVYDNDGEHLFTIGKRGNGPGEFNFPTHVTIKDNLVFVNDTMNFRIQVFDNKGNHIRSFGIHGDAPGHFSHPKGVAIDSQENVYVAETMSNRINIFDKYGTFLMDFGGTGQSPGEFYMPAGMSIFNDRLYVCDSRNGRIQVFKYLRED